MFSLIRGGPKILIFESNSIEALSNYLVQETKATVYNIVDVFEKAGEDHTIIFITKKITDVVDFREVDNAFLIAEEPDVILCNFLNDKMGHLISRSRIATRIILLRVVGDIEKVIKKIGEDYKCVEGDLMQVLNSYNEKGTIVALTEKPIHRIVSGKDMYTKALFIEERYRPLMSSLRSRALKYLNSGLGNKDWYELEIRIYDKYGEFDLHYTRLLNILESLEIGIILGASWGKDYPRPMLAIEIYRVRFFTYYDPVFIKRILLGLEFLDDGTRIVDYDLFYKRKKIYWPEAVEKDIKERNLIAAKYRKEILSKLSEKEIEELREMEEKILATRTDF